MKTIHSWSSPDRPKLVFGMRAIVMSSEGAYPFIGLFVAILNTDLYNPCLITCVPQVPWRV